MKKKVCFKLSLTNASQWPKKNKYTNYITFQKTESENKGNKYDKKKKPVEKESETVDKHRGQIRRSDCVDH